MLITNHTANASTIPSQNFSNPSGFQAKEIDFQAPNNSQAPRLQPLNLMSDTIGDLAVSLFGCDCMNCRQQALAMLQTGQIALPR